MARRQAYVPHIGPMLLAQMHVATCAFAKTFWNEHPGFSLLVYEFQHFATSDFAEWYKEARKFGARITVAYQDRQGLTYEGCSARQHDRVFSANPRRCGRTLSALFRFERTLTSRNHLRRHTAPPPSARTSDRG